MNIFEVISFVVCEQIRPEIGGRYTLLGATSPELNVELRPMDPNASQQPTAIIPVSLFLIGTVKAKGSFDAEIRVNDPKGQQIAAAKIQGQFNASGPGSVGIGPIPLAASLEGKYVFEWKFGDSGWIKIADLKLNIKKASTLG